MKNGLQRVGRVCGRIPGLINIGPLLLGALVSTFLPGLLNIGGFTTALFHTGTSTLIGLFFLCMGAELNPRTTGPAVEKGVATLLGKTAAGVTVGLAVAYILPGGTLFGLVPLAIIAAMTNSNTALYAALMKQFGNTTDRGAAGIIALNDGPFITLLALGISGLAAFPFKTFLGLLIPFVIGFILGNFSPKAREFLSPGGLLLIPFMAFGVGSGINLTTLGRAGLSGILLALMTITMCGGAAMLVLRAIHLIRRRPRECRNVVAGAAEGTTAGNAVAVPAAIALIDPAYQGVEAVATAQVATSTVVTALLIPFVVAFVSRQQAKRGVSVEAEERWYDRKRATPQLATE
ncbi:2-keto-3-deoxygluconate permease [Amycolatopsis acidicola]|uniref:2-keto-3-deoxygluconate permease n=1 Tax=Amycolatopsis acidicola TaxID=2596893 RepID=A0A5N0VC89_9PSEU|nr:2-keto-3-deoxygluconate permease [Amycolatopsis acidicola]KAA9164007.1 2-keto-3-deoxygluconate permease [Amycolatopsis acidicola]